MVCNWILRCFSIRDVSVYLKLYDSYVVPILLYGCQIWHSGRVCDRVILERMQRRFVSMVEVRCGMSRGSLAIPSVEDRLLTADLQQLSRTMRNEELFDKMFDITTSSSRSGFVLITKARAKTDRVNNLFPWRVVRLINSATV